MLTKKHFKAIADVLSMHSDTDFTKQQIMIDLAVLFESENPRFEAERFFRACKNVREQPEQYI